MKDKSLNHQIQLPNRPVTQKKRLFLFPSSLAPSISHNPPLLKNECILIPWTTQQPSKELQLSTSMSIHFITSPKHSPTIRGIKQTMGPSVITGWGYPTGFSGSNPRKLGQNQGFSSPAKYGNRYRKRTWEWGVSRAWGGLWGNRQNAHHESLQQCLL